ncbi:MAG: hypothetical protein R3F43_04565 [bacterium]
MAGAAEGTWGAHWWTVVPHVGGCCGGRRCPGVAWQGRTSDSAVVSGILNLSPGRHRRTLVVVIHGLGGDDSRPYVRHAAAAALAQAPPLRLNLRGPICGPTTSTTPG